jgi:transcriptional regulator with XRE-family HTH domain
MQYALMENGDIELGQRLRKAREAKGLEAQDAAERMRLAYSTLMNHEAGHRGARRRVMDYARLYTVNYVWLASGAGPMKGSDPLLADIQALAPRDRDMVEVLVASLKGRKPE